MLIAELASRFDANNKLLLKPIACLNPSSNSFLEKETLSTMCVQYNIDDEYLDVELKQAKRLIESKKTDCSITTIAELATFMNSFKEAFPDVCRLINIALVLPPTSATCERSFSSLRLIKNYLRSTLSDEKLNACAVIGIHPIRAKNLDLDTFISAFVERHNNRSLQLF